MTKSKIDGLGLEKMGEKLAELGVDEFVQIAKGLYLEGLAVDPQRNLIWYSDVIAGGVHGVTPDGAAAFHLNPERMWTGGVMMNHDGAVLSSGPGGIMWNRPEDGSSGWLVNAYEDRELMGVNEMVSDGHGGIYFGTIDIAQIERGEQTSPSSLFHLSVDRKLRCVAGPFGFANGIMRSRDGKQLFYNSTFDATYVFPVHTDGSLGERQKLLDKEDCDGMTMDADGNILITGYKSCEIIRMSSDGVIQETISTPASAITQVRFGGIDMRDVYLNCVPLDAGDGLAAGDSPTEQRSFLLRGRVEIAGLPLAPAQFAL